MTLIRNTISDPGSYTLLTWTSSTITNNLACFPSGVSTEWGFLRWEETNTGQETTDSKVRIDIIDATTSTVLIGDIVQNLNDSASTLYDAGAFVNDIKIKVKLYYKVTGLYPTVKNIRITYKNWSLNQKITDNLKNVILDRLFTDTPTTDEITKMKLGGDQGTLSEGMTTFVEIAYTPVTLNTNSPELDTSVYTASYSALLEDTTIPNASTIQSIGLFNNDDLLSAVGNIGLIYDNTKKYLLGMKLRMLDGGIFPTQITYDGMNAVMDRISHTAKMASYSHVREIVVGAGSLTKTMSSLTNEYYGPLDFTSTTLDSANKQISVRLDMSKDVGNGYTYTANGIILETIGNYIYYDPQLVSNIENVFDSDSTTYASKTALGDIYVGKIFSFPVAINSVHIKANATTIKSGAGTTTATISLVKYNAVGGTWSVVSTLANIQRTYSATSIQINIKVDQVVDVNEELDGIGVLINTTGDTATEQKIYRIDFNCNERRMMSAGTITPSLAKTSNYNLILMNKFKCPTINPWDI